MTDGIPAGQIAVFVRSRAEIPRARAAAERAGLEFKAVAVMVCDEEVLPLAERFDSIIEEVDLDELY